MLDRLKHLMDYYSLSPSALADSIGVPRSSISHLLTGRNKPSLDFVLKLIKKYPDVNLYWLLNGKGSFPSKREELPKQDTPALFPISESKPKEEKNLPPKPEDWPTKTTSSNKIKKIVFFFEDGSFEAYHPN